MTGSSTCQNVDRAINATDRVMEPDWHNHGHEKTELTYRFYPSVGAKQTERIFETSDHLCLIQLWEIRLSAIIPLSYSSTISIAQGCDIVTFITLIIRSIVGGVCRMSKISTKLEEEYSKQRMSGSQLQWLWHHISIPLLLIEASWSSSWSWRPRFYNE